MYVAIIDYKKGEIKMRYSDIGGIIVSAGLIASFIFKFPLWMNIVFLSVAVVELILIVLKK